MNQSPLFQTPAAISTENSILDFLEKSGELNDLKDPLDPYISDDMELFPVDEILDRLQPELSESIPELEMPQLTDLLEEMETKSPEEVAQQFGFPSPTTLVAEGWDLDMDTCAWYLPLHYYGRYWGKFVKGSCIENFSQITALIGNLHAPTLKISSTQLENQLKIGALIALLTHEQFHHRVESLGIRLHFSSNTPKYKNYYSKVYLHLKSNDPNKLLEESLANAYSYRSLRDHETLKLVPTKAVRDALRKALRASFKFSPPGYKQALNYIDDSNFKSGVNLLQTQMRDSDPNALAADWNLADGLLRPFFKLVYKSTVVRSNLRSKYSQGHGQPLTFSCKDMLKIIKAQCGGVTNVSGGKGSHTKIEVPDGRRIVIPNCNKNTPLSRGVTKVLLDFVGLNAREAYGLK